MRVIHRLRVAARFAYDQSPGSSHDPTADGSLMSSTNPAQPIVLHYARDRPRWWQTAAARRCAGLLLLVALATLGWQFGPDGWRWARE